MAYGDGRIYIRNGIWWISYYDGRGNQVRESTRSRLGDDAKGVKASKQLRSRLAEVRAGVTKPAEIQTKFERLVELIKQDYIHNQRHSYQVDPLTKKETGSLVKHIEHLFEFFAGRSARDIDIALVRRYRGKRLAEGAAPRTINMETACLTRMFSLAFGRGSRSFGKLEGERTRTGFVTVEEFYKIHSHLLDYENGRGKPPAECLPDLVEFVFLCMWRRGRVAGLQWGRDVNYNTRELIPERTGSKTKIDPEPQPIIGRMWEIVERRWQKRNGPYVFHRRGKPVKSFAKQWAKAVKAAEIGRHIVPHDLRRSSAKALSEAGVERSIVKRKAGWRTDHMFERYRIVDRKNMIAAQEQFDALLPSFFPEDPHKTSTMSKDEHEKE